MFLAPGPAGRAAQPPGPPPAALRRARLAWARPEASREAKRPGRPTTGRLPGTTIRRPAGNPRTGPARSRTTPAGQHDSPARPTAGSSHPAPPEPVILYRSAAASSSSASSTHGRRAFPALLRVRSSLTVRDGRSRPAVAASGQILMTAHTQRHARRVSHRNSFTAADRSHLHEFTPADGTPVSPAGCWDAGEPQGSWEGSCPVS